MHFKQPIIVTGGIPVTLRSIEFGCHDGSYAAAAAHQDLARQVYAGSIEISRKDWSAFKLQLLEALVPAWWRRRARWRNKRRGVKARNRLDRACRRAIAAIKRGDGEAMVKALQRLLLVSDAAGIMFEIDSPGGEAASVDELFRQE